ncbi:MAG: DUF1707 SHOCT-like domain-containing protein [Gemmatimonadota bacterium]
MSEPTRPLPAAAALKAQRDRTITALCDHFAQDRLTIEEFEQRLDVANRALTVPELSALLADLPVQQTETVVTAPAPAPVPSAHIREHQVIAAVLGGAERRGHWLPAQRTLVVSAMGGAVLDFRDAQLPAGETELTVICIMGGAEIIVPPGLNVDSGGIAIMGGFAHANPLPATQTAGAPLLRINGFALMGGVDVYVRLPGESARDARHRERDERRRLRSERRRR